MTIEEAAEEILAGVVHVNCDDCDGSGYVTIGVYPPATARRECKSCLGWGYFIRSRYIEACMVLVHPKPFDMRYVKWDDYDQRKSG